MRIFVDTSMFLEYVLPSEGYGRSEAEKDLRKIVTDARRKGEPELVTSHVALGEALQFLHESFGTDKERRIMFDFRKVFDTETYLLGTPTASHLHQTMDEILEKDSRLDQNDCIILAQAVAEDVDSIKATDRDWSIRIEELGIELDIY